MTGFSLIEGLIAIAIIALLSVASVYYGQEIIHHYQKEQITQNLVHALQFAKLQALSQHQQIIVCPLGTQATCGNNWNQGIAIIEARNPPQILQTLPATKIKTKLGFEGWLGHSHAAFYKDGMPHGYHGSFWWCENKHNVPLVVVNQAGRIRVADETHDEDSLKNPCILK